MKDVNDVGDVDEGNDDVVVACDDADDAARPHDEAHADANHAHMHDDADDIVKDTEVHICIWHILKNQKQTLEIAINKKYRKIKR